jgi:hypothetical protein
MRLFPRALPASCTWLLAITLLLAGCGGDAPPPPRSFAPPNYAYLTKIRLNVGQVDIEDHSLTGGTGPDGEQDVSAQSPTPPSVALTEMAHDRLFAAGTSGKAVFVIDQANILRAPNGTLSGLLAIHLDLLTAGGARAGYAEARVAKQYVPGSAPEDFRGTLYDLTNQMMTDMNVELEFQIRKSLKDWLVTSTSVPQPVQAQPLPSPAPVLPPFIPQAPAPQATDQPQMSPPPGYLQAPPGY